MDGVLYRVGVALHLNRGSFSFLSYTEVTLVEVYTLQCTERLQKQTEI